MIEMEKLRALLADARARLGWYQDKDLIPRIDAALAGLPPNTPICVECDTHEAEFCWVCLGKMEKQRDDARADVDRLMVRQRELVAERDERGAFAAAETGHANRWAQRAHAAEKRCEEIGDEASLAQSERDAAQAVAEKLREALELAEVEVALERTWCRICRTENRSNERSRRSHPHEKKCVLAGGSRR